MTRTLRLALIASVAAVLACPPSLALPPEEICPLQEVRAGQRAVAKSVFRGTTIESFHVEVLGVLEKYSGTRALILGRVLDGPVVERESGIIGGMSGSPVYIDGRLAGAIALTWAWSKEPIAGITPIEQMLEAWERKAPSVETASGRVTPLDLELDGDRISRVHVSPLPPAEPDPPGVMTLVPLGGVIQASGFNARSVDRLADLLSPYGLRVVQGPSGSAPRQSPPLAPGAALGARLIGGDFDMTALGTVTVIEGGRILAFGHPLFQRGEIDLPMTGGYVHDILPSLAISNKIMSPTQEVGRVFSDHQAAIAGEIGGSADMLPVNIQVEDTDFGRSRTFNIEVVRVRDLMPGLVASSVMTAIDETRGRIARATSRVSVRVEAEGRPAIAREDVVYGDADGAAAALSAVIAPIAAFAENPFGKLDFRSISIDILSREERQTATIDRVTVSQSRVTAGDTVRLDVAVRPYGKDVVLIPVDVSVPPDLPRGPMRLVISAGDDAQGARSAIGARMPEPVSLDQMIERYASAENSTQLVVQAALTRTGVSMLGEDLPHIPGSVVAALRAVSPTDLRPLPSVMKVVVPTEWALSGRQVVTIGVESAVAPGPPPQARPPAEAPGEEPKEASGFWGPPSVTAAEATPIQLSPGIPVAAGPKAEADDEKEKPKPAARAPQAWTHVTSADYRDATLNGVAVAEDGTLSLAPRPEKAVEVPAEIVWSVAVRNGTTYLGSGSSGRIFRVSDESEAAEFYDTGEMNVHALVFGEGEDLYAATSPRGRLFRITPDGEGELVCDLDCVYLWALVIAADGTVYVGAGAPARVYAVGANGDARLVAELPAANVLSLSLAGDGALYAGTSANGVVYRVGPNGDARALCQVSGQSVDSLAAGADGDLFASASPGGDIWRIPGQGAPELYASTEQRTIYALAYLAGGDIVAATGPGGVLVRVGTDRRPQIIACPETGVATAMAEADGNLYVGSSGPSLLRTYAAAGATSGSIESPVLDPERPAQWGRASWTADIPEGAEVKVETRSGNSPDPDDNWSPWTPTADGFIMSPAGRYLQYRVLLAAETPESSPRVRHIHLSHRPQNRPPVCQIRDPEANQALAKKHTIKWQGRDPDKDTLVYDLAVSADLGKTWDDLETDVTEAKHEWDTSDEEDGRYLLRVTASDRRSVPDDPRSAEAEAVVWIDNTAPEVVLLRSSVAVDEEGRATVAGMALDALCELRGLEYRVDDGTWHSLGLTAVGGSVAEIAVATDPLDPGAHELEVRAFDAAGNHASDTVSVTVEESEAEEADEGGAGPEEAHESLTEPAEGEDLGEPGEGELAQPADQSAEVADPGAAGALDEPDGAGAPQAPADSAGEEGAAHLPGMAAGADD